MPASSAAPDPDDRDVRLAELHASAQSRLDGLDRDIAQLRADRRADNADDEHDPEGVTLSSEWARLAGLREDAVRELADVDAALARRAVGDDGRCADCGRPIPVARLVARPTATRCVDCAARAGA
ncbi:MAG: TraR/DksA family transcriptional regulator [Microbacterium sp.]